MSDVKLIRLISGDEIIGKLSVNEESETMAIQDPAYVHTAPGQGQLQVGLVPMIPFAEEDTVEINPTMVVTMPLTPNTDLLNYYNKMFGAGIQIAGADSI